MSARSAPGCPGCDGEAVMSTFKTFELVLQDALNRLYDPSYRPPEALCTILACDPEAGSDPVQAAILRAIRALKPEEHVPLSARGRRIYDVLSSRYVQKLTQEETAERLGITPRHLRREQRDAVNVLAKQLWTWRWQLGVTPDSMAGDKGDWLSQVRRELSVLRQSAPSTVADVKETIEGVVELMSALIAEQGVTLILGTVEPDRTAAIHPSALRQVLVCGISKLARYIAHGELKLEASQVEERIEITLTSSPSTANHPPDDSLIRELLAMYEGSIVLAYQHDNSVFCRITLPAAGQITVLVVDDNADLIHFYQRYVQGTWYRIVSTLEGTGIFDIIKDVRPDIIVLDVMLPDVDGWELMARLHEHPATRSLPVIICSVVREQELALALGAKLYVPKPVRRHTFIQALDQVLR